MGQGRRDAALAADHGVRVRGIGAGSSAVVGRRAKNMIAVRDLFASSSAIVGRHT